tara:strand:- start:12493 stop:12690 length:198 start_codon:yes stop_codon:yes gene_type:complete
MDDLKINEMVKDFSSLSKFDREKFVAVLVTFYPAITDDVVSKIQHYQQDDFISSNGIDVNEIVSC